MNLSFMKKLVLLALLTAVLAPFQVQADYKALLKSGEELYATDYWLDKVDKNVIRLLINGGMTRIPRSDVRYIAPVPTSNQRVRTAIKRITFQQRPGLASASLSEQQKTATNKKAPSPFQQEAELLAQEQDLAKEAYREALKNGDIEKRQEARDKIQKLTQQLNDLRDRVMVDNLGEVPDWWRW